MGLFGLFGKHKPSLSSLEFEIAGLFAYENEAKELMGKNPVLEKVKKKEGARVFVLGVFDGPCDLVPEPKNKHDKNAIMVIAGGHQLGYVPMDMQEEVKARMKAGFETSISLSGGNRRVYEDGDWVIYKGDIRGVVKMAPR